MYIVCLNAMSKIDREKENMENDVTTITKNNTIIYVDEVERDKRKKNIRLAKQRLLIENPNSCSLFTITEE